MKSFRKVIKIRPDVRFGKLFVRETRISAYDVFSWLASGMTQQYIVEDYPELTNDDIKACLA